MGINQKNSNNIVKEVNRHSSDTKEDTHGYRNLGS
jgi:hypothetical protein